MLNVERPTAQSAQTLKSDCLSWISFCHLLCDLEHITQPAVPQFPHCERQNTGDLTIGCYQDPVRCRTKVVRVVPRRESESEDGSQKIQGERHLRDCFTYEDLKAQ